MHLTKTGVQASSAAIKFFLPDQGPPGTGKTRTILGLLSIVLHSSPHRIEAVGSAKIGALNAAIGHTAKGADLTRLWLKASPWVAGKPTARCACMSGSGLSIA